MHWRSVFTNQNENLSSSSCDQCCYCCCTITHAIAIYLIRLLRVLGECVCILYIYVFIFFFRWYDCCYFTCRRWCLLCLCAVAVFVVQCFIYFVFAIFVFSSNITPICSGQILWKRKIDGWARVRAWTRGRERAGECGAVYFISFKWHLFGYTFYILLITLNDLQRSCWHTYRMRLSSLPISHTHSPSAVSPSPSSTFKLRAHCVYSTFPVYFQSNLKHRAVAVSLSLQIIWIYYIWYEDV